MFEKKFCENELENILFAIHIEIYILMSFYTVLKRIDDIFKGIN